ncbi:hypothetical protein [Candidatus Bealeia paramacronuclearis]|uniref:hypothetical protein n=1 Tax=Candidatus Bealeia paramacronuclearis TaxID=1921001 RepID=UPI002F26D18C
MVQTDLGRSSPSPQSRLIPRTPKRESSFSAATSWGVFQYDGESHLMPEPAKARLPFEELMEQIRRMAIDCTDSHPEYPNARTISPSTMTPLLWNATQGQPLISFLEKMRPRVRVEGLCRVRGSKLTC